jgi:hypothetical protein
MLSSSAVTGDPARRYLHVIGKYLAGTSSLVQRQVIFLSGPASLPIFRLSLLLRPAVAG